MVNPLSIRQLIRLTWPSFVAFHARSPFKLRGISYIGIVMFPAYYFIWSYIFPQPYESATLRTIGFLLSVAGALEYYWPRRLKPYYLPYSYFSIMYGLPTFFTAMTLLNGASAPWLMSLMSAFLFVALLYDVSNAIIVSLAGSILGYFIYMFISSEIMLPVHYVSSLPILAFTVLAVMTLSYNEQLIADERLNTANALASHIAHEMRTHLLGIRFDCSTFKSMFDERNSRTGVVMPQAKSPPVILFPQVASAPAPPDPELRQMCQALARIEGHAVTANLVIEMLLANVTLGKIDQDEFQVHSLDHLIEQAIERYSFDESVRNGITVRDMSGLQFWGSDLLMLHVLFNLLKNALTAIKKKGAGQIEISGQSGSTSTTITFKDTGSGIPSDLLPRIFVPFVTSSRQMQGTGLGLSFCKLVIESFEGTISCQSMEGVGSEFIIVLPLPTPDRMRSKANTVKHAD
jgi:two-component system, CAI-1 autoinducer sensor kinase/phosphatase CqsS